MTDQRKYHVDASVRTKGRHTRTGLVALAAALSCAALAACGGSSPTAGATSHCAERQLTMSSTGAVQAGSCPTDTAIAVDRTAFGQGPEVGAQVASEVLAAASATLTNGGLVSVVLYGRDADRAVTVYQGELTTAAQGNSFDRGEQDQQVESAIHATVSAAFAEPSRQAPRLRASLALLDGSGSDIGRSLRNAIHSVARGDGNASAVVDLTDGYNNTAEFSLTQVIDRESVGTLAHRLAALAGAGEDPQIGLIAIPTLGQVPLQYQEHQQPGQTDRLVKAWSEACHQLRPRHCEISTTA